MTPSIARARRGFTLAEVIVAVVILGIIGGALVRLIISQSRFTETQMAKRNARTVSRNAMNIMVTDLRMVQDSGGLMGASQDSITLRVPIAFGLLCSVNGGQSTVALLPVDSAMRALGYYNGWAYRDSTMESYQYKDTGSPTPYNSIPAGVSTLCTDNLVGPGISLITYNGRTSKVLQLSESPPGTPNPGWPVFIYQIVTYRFQASNAFSGRTGLFRKVRDGTANGVVDEIIAPFDTAAKFRYYVLNEDTAQTAVPSDLKLVRGIQLYLAGSSPGAPQSGVFSQAALVTGVFFKNRRDP
jgi:prepilin-type N-terminal cleavage/methylation domain-containing protein